MQDLYIAEIYRPGLSSFTTSQLRNTYIGEVVRYGHSGSPKLVPNESPYETSY